MLDDSDVKFRDTQVHYLRMDRRIDYAKDSQFELSMELLPKPIDPKYYLELYQGVGITFDWVDRLVISEQQLSEIINSENTEVFVYMLKDVPCGYVEFCEKAGYVEISYFGLFPEYLGKGMGAPCLRLAVNQAWSYDPEWIELNTCDLDNERALAIYTRVGFQPYNTRTEKRRTIF